MKFIVRLLKEPLLHFLVLAAGLFALSRFFGDAPPSAERETIVVGEARIKSLLLTFQRTWQRPPTKREFDGLVEDYIKEEVLYREALAMGLDRDDTLIRRRLRQKLEFVAEDLADAVEPTDEQLQQYLDEHPDSFRVEQRATFRQVYLNRQRRGDSLDADVEKLLALLRSNDGSTDPAELGDRFLLPHYHENLRESEIAGQFGPGFASKLLAAEVGQWTGPIDSAYGVHLVLVDDKAPGRVPDLEEVRGAVRREWFAARRVASREEFFQALRGKYKVVVEMPDWASDDADSAEAKR